MVTEYAEEACLYSFDRKAGHGLVSNGIPELGDGDKSREVMPPPIGKKCRLVEEEITNPIRRKSC